jgi:hypothetical protein
MNIKKMIIYGIISPVVINILLGYILQLRGIAGFGDPLHELLILALALIALIGYAGVTQSRMAGSTKSTEYWIRGHNPRTEFNQPKEQKYLTGSVGNGLFLFSVGLFISDILLLFLEPAAMIGW